MTTTSTVPRHIADYLISRYDLDSTADVRYLDDPDYADGAIECKGRMPNSIETGWFFAGFEAEIERDMARERCV